MQHGYFKIFVSTISSMIQCVFGYRWEASKWLLNQKLQIRTSHKSNKLVTNSYFSQNMNGNMFVQSNIKPNTPSISNSICSNHWFSASISFKWGSVSHLPKPMEAYPLQFLDPSLLSWKHQLPHAFLKPSEMDFCYWIIRWLPFWE